MSETENPLSTSERLPDIYSNNNNKNNNENSFRQSIARRNQVIDDYIKSLDQEKNNKQDTSSEEDDKDPFSSKAIKNLKPLKKVKNRLILPNFQREKLKSEMNSRNNKNKSMPKNVNKNITNENIFKKNKKMQKNKNYSENNIMNKYTRDIKFNHPGKILEINNVNHNLNSKWTKNSASTFNNFINLQKNKKNFNFVQFKNKSELKMNSLNNTLMQQIRSKSHMKQSYELYKEKINSYYRKNNINKTIYESNKYINNIKSKMNNTQIGIIIPYNNAGVNNLYNYEYNRNKRRNFTAKMINTKISIKKHKKFNNYRINSTSNNHRILENKHQTYEKLIQEKSNPYGLYWINKILKKNAKEKVGMSKEFINGVPVVKLLGKEYLSKREIKKKLSEIEKRKKMEENKFNKIIKAEAKLNKNDLDDEYNLPNEIMEQFNRNTKNFFKVRKDIIEQPDEEENFIEH